VPVARIQDIKPAPYVWGKTLPGRCRIQVNPDRDSATHTTAQCNWADKKRQPRSVPRVKYMEVLIADVPLDQPKCETCGGGR
jgi:hypothetical protein